VRARVDPVKILEAQSTRNSSACHTISWEHKRTVLLGAYLCYRCRRPLEELKTSHLPFEIINWWQLENMDRHTEFFQLLNDPQGSNAVGAVTNTVITKVDKVGEKIRVIESTPIVT
jgi:hypothetical protein